MISKQSYPNPARSFRYPSSNRFSTVRDRRSLPGTIPTWVNWRYCTLREKLQQCDSAELSLGWSPPLIPSIQTIASVPLIPLFYSETSYHLSQFDTSHNHTTSYPSDATSIHTLPTCKYVLFNSRHPRPRLLIPLPQCLLRISPISPPSPRLPPHPHLFAHP